MNLARPSSLMDGRSHAQQKTTARQCAVDVFERG